MKLAAGLIVCASAVLSLGAQNTMIHRPTPPPASGKWTADRTRRSQAEFALPDANAVAAYSVLTYSGRNAAPGDSVVISHGDGSLPSFSIRGLPGKGGSIPRAFEVGSAVPFLEPDRSFHIDDSTVDDIAREKAHGEVLENLDHHRPTQTLTALGEHPWQFRNSGSSPAYERCAVRAAMQSSRKASAAADDSVEREQWLNRDPLGSQWNQHDLRAARLLVALVSTIVRDFAQGDLTEWARRRPGDTGSWHSQWRKQMILQHGREFAREAEATEDSAAGALCRILEPEVLANAVSDRCRFAGVIDERDGWPIMISFTRRVKDRRGASSYWGVNFDRLRPNPSFVARPPRCR